MIKHKPLRAMLYDISLLVPREVYDESLFYEYAVSVIKGVPSAHKLQAHVCVTNLVDHRAKLPEDLIYLNQIAYYPEQDQIPKLNVDEPSQIESQKLVDNRNFYYLPWRPLRQSTNTMHLTVDLLEDDYVITDKSWPDLGHRYEYSIDAQGCILCNLKDGPILVSYMRYPKTADGKDYLVPDSETLKRAITHYCIYNHWLKRSLVKEQGSHNDMTFHLKMYELHKAKFAGEINLPNLAEMENIKNTALRIYEPTNEFSRFFLGLNTVKTPTDL